jgi:CcmD family protein
VGREKGPAVQLLLLAVLMSGSLLAQRPSTEPPIVPARDMPPLSQVPPAGTQPQQLEGFVRADQLPQREQLPAAPLVMTAYAVAWAVVLAYVWSIWRRLNHVEREIADVSRRLSPGARS